MTCKTFQVSLWTQSAMEQLPSLNAEPDVDFELYPNPSHRPVISITTTWSGKTGLPIVYTLSGRKIPVTVSSENNSIFVKMPENIASGLYIIRVDRKSYR